MSRYGRLFFKQQLRYRFNDPEKLTTVFYANAEQPSTSNGDTFSCCGLPVLSFRFAKHTKGLIVAINHCSALFAFADVNQLRSAFRALGNSTLELLVLLIIFAILVGTSQSNLLFPRSPLPKLE